MVNIINFKKLSKDKIKEKIGNLTNPEQSGCYVYVEETLLNAIGLIKEESGKSVNSKDAKDFENISNKIIKSVKERDGVVLNKHLLNFFAFMDYLCSLESNNMKMQTKGVACGEPYKIEGEYKDELWKFVCTCDGLNVLCFYDVGITENGFKPLGFKNFKNDMDLVKKFYLGDIDTLEFEDLLKKYLNIKGER